MGGTATSNEERKGDSQRGVVMYCTMAIYAIYEPCLGAGAARLPMAWLLVSSWPRSDVTATTPKYELEPFHLSCKDVATKSEVSFHWQ
jgi:hypothetical protein